MNEVLRNIGRALDKFFAERQVPALDIIDHGDPDAGDLYLDRRFPAGTINLLARNVENYDVLTSIAPASFWLEIERDALD
jgi:hypothetical protein